MVVPQLFKGCARLSSAASWGLWFWSSRTACFTVFVSERETALDLVDITLHSEGDTYLLYTAILGGRYNLQV